MLKHGQNGTRTYRIWALMKQRCLNPNRKDYPYYGGRGVKVAPPWLSFANFFSDMGACPEKHTLERADVNGDYCKTNCTWVTQREQNRNKTTTRWHEVNGVRRLAMDIEHDLGLRRGGITQRLKMGWSTEKAISTPAQIRRKPRPRRSASGCANEIKL